jgi:hypothetical protein
MNFNKTGLFLMLFGSSSVFSQKNINGATTTVSEIVSPVQRAEKNSNITSSSPADTVLVKVQVEGAFYDQSKNNLPFFVISRTTAYEQTASPLLVVKKVLPVAEPHASVIRNYFGSFLTGNFETVAVNSLSKNQNLNKHRLIPFRINAANQVEELVDYEVNWQVSANNNRTFRSAASASFAANSVLSTGTWYKIGVTQTGIHKITRPFLSSLGIDVSHLNPNKIRIYGNGGHILPERNGDFRYDDLQENAIFVADQTDSVFGNDNYVLFYATGTNEWDLNANRTATSSPLVFTVTPNLYSDTSFYFINVDLPGNGKRMVTKPATTGVPANVFTSTYDYYNYHEEDLVNFVKSGRNFFGEYFDITNTYALPGWSDGDFIVGDTLITEATVAARSRTSSNFVVNGSGANLVVTTPSVNVDFYLGTYAAPAKKAAKTILNNSNSIAISVTKQAPLAVGWLDKVAVNARRRLKLNSRQFQFRDSRVSGPGNFCDFSVIASGNIHLWNVTDPLHPFIQSFSSSSGVINFTCPVDSLNEFCIAPTSDLYSPVFVGKIPNQNLHSLTQADYVVVAHPLFASQAQRIAKLHQQQEGLSYAVATTDQIYNEFSSGKQDVAAIRDFVRMLYSRNIASGKEVKYLLLMGDGSYKNKDRSLIDNSNLIPTYQTYDSWSPTASMATDDFYTLMDYNEGVNAESTGNVDLGVGRFICRTAAEASAIVAKIENYYKKDPGFNPNELTPENCNNTNESNMGDWRNWLMFVADDKDGALHMNDANKLTVLVEGTAPTFNIDKIFLDSYKSFSTPGGKRYPDATESFLRRINKGALVFNYTGHGGEGGLTEERILDVPTINSMSNFNKLPLFITATCEFSRYDDPDRTSAGELCLLNPKGGAIALLTTCRVAYSGPNLVLNQLILKNLFTRKANGKWPTLGDVIQETKGGNGAVQSSFYSNFHLLGDPAMPLAYPEEETRTQKINNVNVTLTSSDTLGALSKMTFSGYVCDSLGAKLTNFNGLVYSSVFDKKRVITCLLNDPESAIGGGPFQFSAQKNLLYRGKSLVTNGDFSFTFIVPKDISFAPGQGRISYYATNGLTDAAGLYTNVVVGGNVSKNVILDSDGPQVGMYLNDKNFVNGGTTNEKPVLYANLIDSSGINTTGNGIGHDISVVLDASGSNPVLLNDYYESNLNSYQSGRVRYPFNELSEGEHRLTFKVWDIQNNSSTAYSDFIVAKSGEIALKHVLNYPNPFTTRTQFFFEHNQACTPLRVIVQIYTISGKAVKTIYKSLTCDGFRPEGIDWDGKDDYGDKLARGVYIYKLSISDVNNKKAEKIEKLVILN